MFGRLWQKTPSVLHVLPYSRSFMQPKCHDHETSALMQFKDTFIIDKKQCVSGYPASSYPKFSSWTAYTGFVIGLDLSSSCLYGSINSTSTLFHLLHLQSLNLANNYFNFSQIPTGLAHLSQLTYLNLSQLSKMSTLNLSRNSTNLGFEGSTFISLIQNLTRIKMLFLGNVDIASAVPEMLANLSSLSSLDLKGCGFIL